MKPIDYDALFERKEINAALTESIGSIKVRIKRTTILPHFLNFSRINITKGQEKPQC